MSLVICQVWLFCSRTKFTNKFSKFAYKNINYIQNMLFIFLSHTFNCKYSQGPSGFHFYFRLHSTENSECLLLSQLTFSAIPMKITSQRFRYIKHFSPWTESNARVIGRQKKGRNNEKKCRGEKERNSNITFTTLFCFLFQFAAPLGTFVRMEKK